MFSFVFLYMQFGILFMVEPQWKEPTIACTQIVCKYQYSCKCACESGTLRSSGPPITIPRADYALIKMSAFGGGMDVHVLLTIGAWRDHKLGRALGDSLNLFKHALTRTCTHSSMLVGTYSSRTRERLPAWQRPVRMYTRARVRT